MTYLIGWSTVLHEYCIPCTVLCESLHKMMCTFAEKSSIFLSASYSYTTWTENLLGFNLHVTIYWKSWHVNWIPTMFYILCSWQMKFHEIWLRINRGTGSFEVCNYRLHSFTRHRLNTCNVSNFFFSVNLKYNFTVSYPGKPNGMFIKTIGFFSYIHLVKSS